MGHLLCFYLLELGMAAAWCRWVICREVDLPALLRTARTVWSGERQVLGELLRMQTEPIVILAAVGKELRRLYTARMALDGGKDRLWLKQLWNMSSDYPAKLLMQAARKVDHDWCRTAVLRCQQLDRRMKSMSMPDKQKEDELKLFLMELAGRR